MHPAIERLPAGREGVAMLFEELAAIPEDAFLFLARRFSAAEQARRNAAWGRVLEEAEFRHRDDAIDEIRAAAIDHVAVRHSALDLRYSSSPFGLAASAAVHDPDAQARVVNAIIEAAGAILVGDLVEDDVVDILAGPVLDLLAVADAVRAEAERRRRDPYGLGET